MANSRARVGLNIGSRPSDRRSRTQTLELCCSIIRTRQLEARGNYVLPQTADIVRAVRRLAAY